MREQSKKSVKTRLLALVLVFCMTLQMTSYSPRNVARAEGEGTDAGVSEEALTEEGLPESIQLPETTEIIEEAPADVPEKEPAQPTDWTGQNDKLKLTLTELSYQKGDEAPVVINSAGNKWDLSALTPEDAGQLAFKWQYAFAEDAVLNSGDTFSLGMPKNAEGKVLIALKDTEAPVALADEQDNVFGSYEIKDSTATVTLNEAAAESTETVSGILELSGALNAEALKAGETTDATLAPQGEAGAQWTLVLPGKAAAEPTPSAEPTPITEPEQKKENPVMNGLKALFGVQKATVPSGPQDVTNETSDITLEIPYVTYQDPDGVVSDVPMKTEDNKTTIDLSQKPYEPGSKYQMELDFTLIDKDGEDNLPDINEGDYFLFKIPKALIAPTTDAPVDITSPTGQVIAKYTVEEATENYVDGTTKDDYPFFVKVTFTNIVDNTDYYGISGGFTLNLALNPDGVKNPEGDTINLKPQSDGGHAYEIKLPPIKHKVEGISKSAVYNEYKEGDAYKKEITWNITVGDKTPGADLAGVKVVDTLPAELRGPGLIKSVKNDNIDLTAQTDQYQTTATGFTYTFPQNTTAPQTITVVTTVPVSVYNALADKNAQPDAEGKVKKDLKNEVELTNDSDYVTLEGETKADATATIERPTISKTGEQKSSDLIVWTITVNDTGAGNARYNIYDAVVTDTMSADLSMDDEMLGRISVKNMDTNADISVEKWTDAGEPNPATDKNNYYTYRETGTDGEKELKFYFYGSNNLYERTMSSAVRIEFETKVDARKYDPSDNPDEQGRKNKNTATLTCGWPYGTGPGPGIEYGLGPIGTDYRDVYVDKTGKADTATGLITWTIDPSTRLTPRNTERATITDTIIDADYHTFPQVGKHTFVPGTIKVYDENDADKKAIASGVQINEPTNGSNKFTVSIDQDAVINLDSLRIEYQTKADDFFDKPDSVDYKYKNHVDLAFTTEKGVVLNTSDDADVVFPNRFLSKGTEFIKGGTQADGSTIGAFGDAYMKYTLRVNENRIPFGKGQLTVEDDLSQLKTYILDKDGKNITGSPFTGLGNVWTYQASMTVITENDGSADTKSSETITNSSDKLTFKPDNPSGKQYTITFYLKLKEEAKSAYLATGDCKIYTENAASANGTYDGKTIKQDVTSTGDGTTGTMVNKLADKEHGSESGDVLKLNWKIDINPYAATLGKEADTTLTIEDTIASGLEFDRASIKFLEKGTDGNYTEASPALNKSAIKVTENADSGYTMTLDIPKDSTTYRLEYATNVIGRVSGNMADNHAVLKLGDTTLSESGSSSSIDRNAWGTLQTRTTYKFVKHDSLTGTSKPLAGATFGLYSKEDCKDDSLINYYTSNAQGIVKFPALDFSAEANKQYYYKEIGVPEGYKLPNTPGVEIKKETADSTGQVANSRLSEGTATITKQFDNPSSGTASNQQSEFKLYLYPKDNFGGKRMPVVLTGSDGSYVYDNGTEAKPADGTVMKNNSTSGELKITGLPWGDYALEEVNPSPGYAAVEGEQRFTVKYDAKATGGSQWTTEYQFGTESGKTDGKITNGLTKFEVKKTSESGKDLAGAKFEIQSVDADTGEPSGTAIKNHFDSSKTFIWDITAETKQGHTEKITGLPVGTYYLVETAGPTDATIAMSKPVKFTLDNYGKITEGGDKNTNTVTMSDPTVKIKAAKKDQFKAGVTGAELTITESTYGAETSSFAKTSGGDAKTIDSTNGTPQEVTGLKRGKTYQLEEITTPAGYLQANAMVFSIDDYGKITILNNGDQTDEENDYKNQFDGNQTLTLTDERIVGHVQFKKMDSYLPEGKTDYRPLAGVQFDLYQAKGDKPAEGDDKVNANNTHFVSQSDGTVTTLNCGINDQSNETLNHGLRPGTYYFKEVATHNDFVLPTGDDANTPTFEVKSDGTNRYSWKNETSGAADSGKHYIIDITKDSQPYAMLNDPFRCDIFFTKTDAEPNTDGSLKGVIGATYGLYSDAACKTPVTDNAGNKRTVTTKAAGSKNEYTDSNGNQWTHNIVNDGEAYFCDVPRSDALYIKETIPAPGYTLNETVIGPIKTSDLEKQHTINLNTNSPSINGVTGGKITDEQNKIYIEKLGSDNKLLSNTHFKLTPETGKQFADKTDSIEWTSDNTALGYEIKGKLIAGDTYTLTETQEADGYIRMQGAVTFKVNGKGEITEQKTTSDFGGEAEMRISDDKFTLTIKNAKTHFKIDKISSDGDQKVNGATLVISSNQDGSDPLDTWTRDEGSNTHTVTGLKADTYWLVETQTPEGYLTAAPIQFTLNADNTIKLGDSSSSNGALSDNLVKMTDTRIYGQAKLTKTDKADPAQPLKDVPFKLYKYTGDTPNPGSDTLIAEGLKTNDQGIIATSAATDIDNEETGKKLSQGLWTGQYYFMEEATDGLYYTTENNAHLAEFTIDKTNHFASTNSAVDVEMKNDHFTTSIQLAKRDKGDRFTEEQPLGGVTFTVKRQAAGNTDYTETAGTLITNDQGKANLNLLKKGKYQIVETPKDGYAAEQQQLFTAIFEVNDSCFNQTLTIAENGNNSKLFSLQKTAGDWNTSGILNTRKPASFILEKIDSHNSDTKLNGAKFELYTKTTANFATDNSKKLVLTAETGKTYDCSKATPTETDGNDGQLVLNNLPWGDYWIIETVPPAGYQLPAGNTAKAFTVGAAALDGKWVSGSDNTVTNDQNTLTLNKVKVDGASALSGAKLEITDSAGNKIGETVLSNSANSWTVTGALTAGETYNLNEPTVPAGYEAPAKKDDKKGYLAQIQMDNSGNVSIIDNNMADGFITTGTDNKSITLKNQPIEVSFGKTDIDGKPLTGAKFEITGTFADGTSPIEITDSNATTALNGKLIAGNNYTVKETTPPKGYKIAPEFGFTVNADGTVTLSGGLESYVSVAQNDQTSTTTKITVKDDLVRTKIKKTDADGNPISGAEFTIKGKFKDDTTTEKAQVVKPTETGAAEILNLIESSSRDNPDYIYTLEETRAADGYQCVTETVEFFICPQAKVHFKPESGISGVTGIDTDEITMIFKDAPIKLELKKTDESGTPLGGVTFNLKGKFADNPSTETTKALTSNDGTYDLDKMLVAGESYNLKEINAPQQYQIYENDVKIQVSEDGKNITIEGNHDGVSIQNNVLTFKDKLKLGDIIFTKKAVNDTGDTSPAASRGGVTFGLYSDSACQNQLAEAVSSEDGTVRFENLPVADYYLKELRLPSDVTQYLRQNDQVYMAKIDGSQEANTGGQYGITLAAGTAIDDNTIVNTVIRGSITLKKIDGEYKDANNNNIPLSGAEFTVCLKDKNTEGKTIAVASIVHESTGSENYVLRPADSSRLGDGYQIETANSFGVDYLFNNKLLAGSYNITETKTPDGYHQPEDPVAELYIAESSTKIDGQEAIEATITNITNKQDIIVQKLGEETDNSALQTVHEAKAPKAGFTFELKRVAEPNGDAPAFSYTDTRKTDGNDGKATFANVPMGRYELAETASEDLGYLLSEEKQTVTVNYDGTVDYGSAKNPAVFENSLKRGSITGTKVDASSHVEGEPGAAGAVIGLYENADDAVNAALATTKTDDDGNYTFGNIPYGTYYIKEKAVPENSDYLLNETQMIEVTVDDGSLKEGKVRVSDEITNTLPTGSFTIEKTDAITGTALAGVTFKLEGKTSDNHAITAIENKKTDSDGKVTFDNIPVGKYTLTETASIDHYQTPTETAEWEVELIKDNNGTVKTKITGITEKDDAFQITNNPIVGSVRFTKKDTDGRTLAGIGFTLTRDGDLIDPAKKTFTATSDADGVVSFIGIPYGDYQLTENTTVGVKTTMEPVAIKTEDLKVAADGQSFDYAVNSGVVENTLFKGSVSLTKVDQNDAALAGVAFDVTRKGKSGSDGFELNPTDNAYTVYAANPQVKSNDQGVVSLDNLPMGSYKLTENFEASSIVDSIATGQEPITVAFTIDAAGKADITPQDGTVYQENNTWKIKNFLKSGTLQINKIFGDQDSAENTENTARPNAKFDIFADSNNDGQPDGAVVMTLTTNEKGQFVSNEDGSYTQDGGKHQWLLEGNYLLKETASGSEDYMTDSDYHHFAITENTVASVETEGSKIINNPHRGTLEITKFDEKYTIDEGGNLVPAAADNNTQLNGAVFAVCLKGEPQNVVTTLTPKAGETGVYVLPQNAAGQTIEANALGVPYLKDGQLLKGDYTIVEVTPPTGYEDKQTTKDITIGTGENADIVDKIANVLIEKPFAITKLAETADAQKITESGEFKAAAKDAFAFTLTRDAGQTPEFAYTRTVKTDENGIADFKEIPYGTYSLAETETPDSHIPAVLGTLNVDTDGVHYTADNKTETIDNLSVNNSLKRGSITGKKIDNTTAPNIEHGVSGAVMGLFTKDGKTKLAEAVTAKDGSYRFDNIPYGDYQIREIIAPEGYYLSLETAAAEIRDNGGNVTTDVIHDAMIKGNFTLIKKDAEGEHAPLAGTAFTLKGTNFYGDTVNTTVTTGENGEAVFNDIPLGSYTLTESTQPENFTQFTPQSYSVAVVRGNDNTAKTTLTPEDSDKALKPDRDSTYSITNERNKGNIVFNKVGITGGTDDPGKPLSGAKFGLYRDAKCSIAVFGEDNKPRTAVSDERGTVTFKDVSFGEYYVKEIGHVINYLPGAKAYKAVVNGDGSFNGLEDTTDNIVTNERNKGSVTLTKIDSEDSFFKLDGAEFTVYQNDKPVKTGITGDDGILQIDGLLLGQEYRITETKAPVGHQLPDPEAPENSRTFTLADDQATESETAAQVKLDLGNWENEPNQGDIIFTKYGTNDENNKDSKAVLPGAVFGLYKDLNTTQEVQQATSSPDGTVSFKDIYVGSYYVKEISTPANYQADETIYQAIIKEDGTFDGLYPMENNVVGSQKTDTVINEAVRGSITLHKTDSVDNKPLEEVEFTLTKKDSDGKDIEVQKASTDSDGKLTFSNLLMDIQYTVTETATLNTYILSTRQESMTLKDTDAERDRTINWTNPPTELTFKKVDTTGAGLKGAVFTLYDGGKEETTATSAEDGTVIFRYLEKGKTYTVKETSRPGEDYLINTTEFKAVVDKDGTCILKDNDQTVTEVVNADAGVITLTKTGDGGNVLAGAVFDLKNDKGEVIQTQTTAENGQLMFKDVPMGSYTIVETAAPDTYQVSDDVTQVTLSRGAGQKAEISRKNTLSQVIFHKRGVITETCAGDRQHAPLEGAEYGLYSSPDCAGEPAYTATSSNPGDGCKVIFTGVARGIWYVKEMSAPQNYLIDQTIYKAVVDSNGHYESLTNLDGTEVADNRVIDDAVTTDIVLKKVNEQNPEEILPGSTYGLFKKSAKAVPAEAKAFSFFRTALAAEEDNDEWQEVARATTDDKGYLRFEGVLMGVEYTVRELIAPEGSHVSEKPVTIKFKIDDQTGKIVVESIDLGLADPDDPNSAPTAAIDPETGEIVWLEPSIVAEISKVDVNQNLLAGAKLRITVKDESGAYVPLTQADGQPVEWVSGDKAEEFVKLMKLGEDYRLEEVEAPAGYTLAASIDFKVTSPEQGVGPGENHTDQFVMTDELTSFYISKTTINSTDELPGAVLTVYNTAEDGSIARDEAGNEVVAQTITGESLSWTSGTEMKKIEGLKIGTYVLRETTAPDGYEVAEEITFTLMPDGTVTVGGEACEGNIVRMQDKPAPETPGVTTPQQPGTPDTPEGSTGAATGIFGAQNGLWGFMALLAVAVLAICGTVVFRKKHR